jgi:hypothetical protein
MTIIGFSVLELARMKDEIGRVGHAKLTWVQARIAAESNACVFCDNALCKPFIQASRVKEDAVRYHCFIPKRKP